MPSTPNLKLSDDPHDIVVVTPDPARVAPDPVRVAPADEELSSLLQEAAARHFSNPPTSTRSGSPASPAVDTTFRPTAVNDALAAGAGRSMGRRALRAFVTLLLAGCIGLAAVAWRAYGDAAKKQIAKLTTQVILTPSLSSENPAPAAQPATPAVTADAANAAAPAQNAAQAVAPAAGATAADSAQLQSMARDLASMGQEMGQLKASIEQLKASQQQASREIARVPEARAAAARPSEQNVRPRTPATISATSPPPRPAEARPRRPASQATAPPPAPAPYYASRQPDYAPRQPDYAPRQIPPPPQVMADPPPLDPELTPVPRPPMPLR